MPDLRARFPSTLPVWPVDEEGHCTCYFGLSCERPGKHADARAPEDSPAYAVLAGPGGVLVVDVDIKGGVDGFEQLKGWNLPPTLEVHTPSGGRHLFYLHPGGELSNRKLETAIDVRANPRNSGGHSYVIGPGSPGYLKTSDPCTVTPGDPYEIAEDAPIAPCPDILTSFLAIDANQREAHAAAPLSKDHERYASRLEKGREYARTAAASSGDGMGGTNLLKVCLRLVRALELHDDDAHTIIGEEFNPRCTSSTGAPWPWAFEDVQHKIDDARYRSNLPCGLDEGISDALKEKARAASELQERMAQLRANATSHTAGKVERRKEKNPAHRYTCKIGDDISANGDATSVGEALNVFAKNVEWMGVLQFDELRQCIRAVDPPVRLSAESSELTEEDVTSIRFWFETHGMTLSKDNAWDVVKRAADELKFNPLVDYLESRAPSTGAIATLCDVLGQTTELARAYVTKTLVAAVRRAISPGCKVDTMLTLLGVPGVRKSSFVSALFGQEWIAESLPDLSDEKKCGEVMAGKWAIEIAELASVFAPRQRDTSIAFLTRTTDTFRGAYARGNAKARPRSCVFVGTVNDPEILRDAHGADVRRLWVIEITYDIDTTWVAANRDAIWSEAYALASSGMPHWLSPEEEAKHAERAEDFRAADDWTHPVESYCKGKEEVRGLDVYVGALQGEPKGYGNAEMRRLGAILRKVGCIRLARRNVWTVPDRLSSIKKASLTRVK